MIFSPQRPQARSEALITVMNTKQPPMRKETEEKRKIISLDGEDLIGCCGTSNTSAQRLKGRESEQDVWPCGVSPRASWTGCELMVTGAPVHLK